MLAFGFRIGVKPETDSLLEVEHGEKYRRMPDTPLRKPFQKNGRCAQVQTN